MRIVLTIPENVNGKYSCERRWKWQLSSTLTNLDELKMKGFGVWDIKNKTSNRKDTDKTYESLGEFGKAHFKLFKDASRRRLNTTAVADWIRSRSMMMPVKDVLYCEFASFTRQ